MRLRSCLLLFLLWALPTRAQGVDGTELTARSASGQFYVHALHTELSRFNGAKGSVVSTGMGAVHVLSRQTQRQHPDANPLRLDSSLVTLACERVKQAFLKELHLEDRWTGEIHFYIQPLIKVEQVSVTAVPLQKGWIFRVVIPREMREEDLDRLILHVVLQERSTRTSNEMLNNVPHWLTEGLFAYLREKTPDNLSVQRITVIESHSAQTVALRNHFYQAQPLSFEELSWPDAIPEPRQAEFVPSAHLFVAELLSLEGGAVCLGRMIDNSPKYRNWQFAFLEAFQGRFQNLVEAEKWWSLSWIALLGVTSQQMWTTEIAWEKLNASLVTAVMVQTNRTEMPVRQLLTLQQGIRDVPAAQHDELFAQVMIQLRLLHVHSPPGPATLAQEYDDLMMEYLSSESVAGLPPRDKHHPAVNLDVLKRTTCAKLDLLDRKRVKVQADLKALTQQVSTNR